MTTLYLIRHGVTAANKENRFAGRSEESLHADGIKQIRQVGEQLQRAGISRVFAGPSCRTRQSAELISGLVGADLTIEKGLDEISLPHWDGLSKDAIRERFGSEYPTWLADPAGFQVEGCETLADVQERAVNSVERILGSHTGETMLAVTHLIVARCLLLHYLKQPLNDFRSLKVDNGAVVQLIRTADGTTNVTFI